MHTPRVRAALEHNLRHTLQARHAPEGVNASLTHTNSTIGGLATVGEALQAIFDELAAVGMAGLPTRAKAAALTEVVVSAPDGVNDPDAYLADALAAVCEVLAAPLIQAAQHRDQGRPHFHALFLPVQAGKWVGSRLHDRDAVRRLHARLSDTVGKRHGVRLAARLKGERKALGVQMLDRWFQDSPARECPSFPAIRAAYCAHPDPFLERLGLEVPARSFASIMTGTGARTAEDGRSLANAKCLSSSQMGNEVLKQKLLHRIGVCSPPAPSASTVEVLKQFAPVLPPPPAGPTAIAATATAAAQGRLAGHQPFEQPDQPRPPTAAQESQPASIQSHPKGNPNFQPGAALAPTDWRSRPPDHVKTPDQLARWLRNRGERERRKRKLAKEGAPSIARSQQG